MNVLPRNSASQYWCTSRLFGYIAASIHKTIEKRANYIANYIDFLIYCRRMSDYNRYIIIGPYTIAFLSRRVSAASVTRPHQRSYSRASVVRSYSKIVSCYFWLSVSWRCLICYCRCHSISLISFSSCLSSSVFVAVCFTVFLLILDISGWFCWLQCNFTARLSSVRRCPADYCVDNWTSDWPICCSLDIGLDSVRIVMTSALSVWRPRAPAVTDYSDCNGVKYTMGQETWPFSK